MTLNEFSGDEILITGGAGFIGSHIADALVSEANVTVLDDLSSGKKENIPEGAEFVHGDIRDESVVTSVLDEVDLVFHQAAKVSVDQSVDDPIQTHQTNLDASLFLLEEARKRDIRVVLASSTAIYGTPESLPVQEIDRKSPNSPYGLDKLALDHYARIYQELYDTDIVPLRYFNVYGPRQGSGPYGGVISIFVNQALNDDPITVHGDGTQTRDFVHVSDVVEANLRAATSVSSGKAVNVGTGTETSVVELARMIVDIADSDSEIVHESPRPGDVPKSRADITRLGNDLGYSPNVSLREGLRDLIEYRSSHEGT